MLQLEICHGRQFAFKREAQMWTFSCSAHRNEPIVRGNTHFKMSQCIWARIHSAKVIRPQIWIAKLWQGKKVLSPFVAHLRSEPAEKTHRGNKRCPITSEHPAPTPRSRPLTHAQSGTSGSFHHVHPKLINPQRVLLFNKQSFVIGLEAASTHACAREQTVGSHRPRALRLPCSHGFSVVVTNVVSGDKFKWCEKKDNRMTQSRILG